VATAFIILAAALAWETSWAMMNRLLTQLSGLNVGGKNMV